MKTSLVIAAAWLPLQGHPASPPAPAPPAPRLVAPAQPRADPQSWLRAEDYPEPALRLGEQGRVGYALEVGVDGRVRACSLTRPSGSASLDAATCRIMRARARFFPGRDSNGNPSPSTVDQEVSWTLSESGAAVAVTLWGSGMVAHSLPPPPAVVARSAPIASPPVVAIPQDGPGEAELSVWQSGGDVLVDLGRYESFAACRRVKAMLRLRSDQRAWCTRAPDGPAR